ncbi:MAG: hypothetical protein Q8Q35_03750 [Nanoarchaeota archaeon]|nr:hypothetical protein [Nanoarchaeota archaeon]
MREKFTKREDNDENMYPEEIIEEDFENDGIDAEEEGFWIGYNHAY